MDRLLARTRTLGFALASAFAIAASVQVATEARIEPAPPIDAATRARLGREFAAMEPGLRRGAVRGLPGHLWTQDDHFHSLEQGWARAEARRHQTSVGDVLLAIDEDLRRHPADGVWRLATVPPCQPLPFYD
ncbi:MAG: hypothetical protein H5U40_07960 [Polyangiaceae bacterium]|nr:hypothetical protein [Polyangiaceae bacterium]